MIKEFCEEINKILDNGKNDYNHLRELIINVMKDGKDLPDKFIDMVYDIHEDDSLTAEDEKTAKENNLHTPEQFIVFLKQVREKNNEFW